ncbi:MAG: DMT family transporter [Bacteroidetes bacterium]|nr:DMT family transporter [Bacteroidota bacterium]
MTNALKSWILLIILSIIWGSSFILMKRAMYSSSGETIFSSSQVGSLRMLIASTVLLPWAFKSWRALKSYKDLVYFFVVGTCGSFLPAFLFTFAETSITSGLAGMLNSFTPIFTLLLTFLVFRQRLYPFQYLGVSIGTIGIILLVLTGQKSALSGDFTHIFAVVLATLLYAISLSTIKYKLSHYTSLQVTSISLSLVWLPSLLIVIFSQATFIVASHEFAKEGLTAIILLALIGTALATVLFNITIRLSSPLFASSVTYLMPIVSVLIGWQFDEVIDQEQIGSMLIILLGVLLANLPLLMSRFKTK